jgi:3-hydroxyisobutyrate dehydrogenase-like beta-hydroxyacid dehydrogenase
MTPLANHTIGFIGLGLMGRPMCLNLHQAGARLVVYNRNPAPAQALARPGITALASPAAVARAAPIIVIMVADTPAVEAVLFGEHGLAAGLPAGALVIDMGTTDAHATRAFARRIESLGADYVDAPVSGGQIGAIDGTLTIMAGGSETAIARARPLFEVMGSACTHIGAVGAGQVAKAANQVIVGLTIGAVAEALALVMSEGVDPARVRAAMLHGFAASRILEVHGQRMIDGDFRPGGKVTTQHKDMQQAVALAARHGLELPASRLNMGLYERLIAQGDGALDHSALIKLLVASSG